MIKIKIKAFTLAEVLITLVIIGVVAALTIPNLLQKYQEQATVKKVQKFYSNLSNAYSLAVKENGPASEWGLTGNNEASANKIYEILFKPYFKISKNCGGYNKGNCLANVKYKRPNNEISPNYASASNYYKIALDDGATVWFRGKNEEITQYDIVVFYDANGIKEPNQWGKDLFDFDISNIVFPVGLQSGKYSVNPFSYNCKSNGGGCAAWIIHKGNMDYLHCDGLTWNSKSCKEK